MAADPSGRALTLSDRRHRRRAGASSLELLEPRLRGERPDALPELHGIPVGWQLVDDRAEDPDGAIGAVPLEDRRADALADRGQGGVGALGDGGIERSVT